MIFLWFMWLIFDGNIFLCEQVGFEVMLMLTLTAVSVGANQNLPPVSYVKASDIWSFTCLFMVMAVMLESILESYSQSLLKAKNSLRQKGRTILAGKGSDGQDNWEEAPNQNTISEWIPTRETWQVLMSSELMRLVTSLWRILVVLCNGIISVHRWRYEQEVHQKTSPHLPLALPLVLPLLQHLFLAQIHCVPPAWLLRASALSLCAEVSQSPDVFAVMMFFLCRHQLIIFSSLHSISFVLPHVPVLLFLCPETRQKCHRIITDRHCLTRWSSIFWIQPKEVPHQGDSGVSRSMRCVSIPFMNTKSCETFVQTERSKNCLMQMLCFVKHSRHALTSNVGFKAGPANPVCPMYQTKRATILCLMIQASRATQSWCAQGSWPAGKPQRTQGSKSAEQPQGNKSPFVDSTPTTPWSASWRHSIPSLSLTQTQGEIHFLCHAGFLIAVKGASPQDEHNLFALFPLHLPVVLNSTQACLSLTVPPARKVQSGKCCYLCRLHSAEPSFSPNSDWTSSCVWWAQIQMFMSHVFVFRETWPRSKMPMCTSYTETCPHQVLKQRAFPCDLFKIFCCFVVLFFCACWYYAALVSIYMQLYFECVSDLDIVIQINSHTENPQRMNMAGNRSCDTLWITCIPLLLLFPLDTATNTASRKDRPTNIRQPAMPTLANSL